MPLVPPSSRPPAHCHAIGLASVQQHALEEKGEEKGLVDVRVGGMEEVQRGR